MPNIENSEPEIDPHKYAQVIFKKDSEGPTPVPP